MACTTKFGVNRMILLEEKQDNTFYLNRLVARGGQGEKRAG
jgi:hypothetical protein